MRTPTPKQQKFISLLLENMGKQRKTKTLGGIAKEAGYSNAMASNPHLILQSRTIRKELKEFINKLREKRDMALDGLTKEKIEKASARDIAGTLDILIKNQQLLGGNTTEHITITEEEKREVDEAFESNT